MKNDENPAMNRWCQYVGMGGPIHKIRTGSVKTGKIVEFSEKSGTFAGKICKFLVPSVGLSFREQIQLASTSASISASGLASTPVGTSVGIQLASL